jgi:hypothetical protein
MTHGKRFRRWPWQEQTGVTVLATDARRTVAPSGVAELHPPDATQPLQRRP